LFSPILHPRAAARDQTRPHRAVTRATKPGRTAR
jgi:hypothetical protein